MKDGRKGDVWTRRPEEVGRCGWRCVEIRVEPTSVMKDECRPERTSAKEWNGAKLDVDVKWSKGT